MRRPCRLFQVIENQTAYAYSAYVDDRSTARDVIADKVVPVVRVFAYFVRGTRPTVDWRCVLWYKGLEGSGTMAKGSVGIVVPVYGATDLDLITERRYTIVLVNLRSTCIA